MPVFLELKTCFGDAYSLIVVLDFIVPGSNSYVYLLELFLPLVLSVKSILSPPYESIVAIILLPYSPRVGNGSTFPGDGVTTFICRKVDDAWISGISSPSLENI